MAIRGGNQAWSAAKIKRSVPDETHPPAFDGSLTKMKGH
jgi:hypothetical protein